MLPQSWSSPYTIFSSDLPPHCTPTTPFLEHFSKLSHTCVPTPLAFLSTLLGTLSIVAWLFAQLPQIYKNYKLKSTAGLSVFFLAEWCLGDISNITGAILTQQATWQILIGGYYCFVDFSLVIQWIWYERLKHGRQLKKLSKRRIVSNDSDDGGADMAEVVEGIDPQGLSGKPKPLIVKAEAKPTTGPRDISFRTPNYGSFQSTKEQSMGTPNSRTILRVQQQSLPCPSPKTIIFLTLLISLARGSPLPTDSTTPLLTTTTTTTSSSLDNLGTILSWMSTSLYLGSRLPQLIKNHSRRSTAGLSLTLFVAAFFGNLFYSTSMLLNPLAWGSYGPHGCHGWVGPNGSKSSEWITNALPFFLGAAGVLIMDAGVAVQFWWFGENGQDKGDVVVIVAPVDDDRGDGASGAGAGGVGVGKGKRMWREVNGWMRGWKPSASGFTTPRPASPRDGEVEGLLGVGPK